MKNSISISTPKSVITFVLVLFSTVSIAQGVGINETGATPDNSAILDLNSTNKGFLITRVDTVDIVTPAFGLMTLSPTDSCLFQFNGVKWIGMGGGGTNCPCNCSNPTTPPSSAICTPSTTTIVDVTNPTTGKTWMDRNLGASQAATSSTDVLSYGDLYQWGRCSDGHEKRTSATTITQSTSDTPGHGDFIISSSAGFDWRNPNNDNLWQGLAGINNPCPTGYRIPTESEFEAERLSWTSNDAAGAFNSPLKFTLAGLRDFGYAVLLNVGGLGNYWSSTINGSDAERLNFSSGSATTDNYFRANGMSIRCIKN